MIQNIHQNYVNTQKQIDAPSMKSAIELIIELKGFIIKKNIRLNFAYTLELMLLNVNMESIAHLLIVMRILKCV